MSGLLLSFYGDDFTGSTDAMESLARAGIRTVLFTDPPRPDQLRGHGNIQAFGVAGMTRSMRPDAMERTLRPAFENLREAGAPIVHYKVCSTFDSSPLIGSIGKAIDVGMEVFGEYPVPVIVGAPALGRFCIFGNLFAECGTNSEIFRLDRHPSMSRHPTTPMSEADLRAHLAGQTKLPIGLIDVLAVEHEDIAGEFAGMVEEGVGAVVIDVLFQNHLATIGEFLKSESLDHRPLFVVGSSSVESAIAEHLGKERQFKRAGDAGPIIAVCGSRSPVTAQQIRWAAAHGFLEISKLDDAVAPAVAALKKGQSVVIHSRDVDAKNAVTIGSRLGELVREIMASSKPRRVLVAGGDTSGSIARALDIESMEMVAELTRGSPLCRVSAPDSPADGIEMTFKGGQIGKIEFFGQVRDGVADS